MPPRDTEEWGLPEGADDDAATDGLRLPPVRRERDPSPRQQDADG
jgi:hypothetical protein